MVSLHKLPVLILSGKLVKGLVMLGAFRDVVTEAGSHPEIRELSWVIIWCRKDKSVILLNS